jgi:hypothetical protein
MMKVAKFFDPINTAEEVSVHNFVAEILKITGLNGKSPEMTFLESQGNIPRARGQI